MSTWNEGVEAIERAQPAGNADRPPTPTRRTRSPVIVMGAAGSGKTAIWRHLTGRPAPDMRSDDVEQDWLPLARARRRTAITTIPGQASDPRTLRLERYFGRDTVVGGVIFVASFGFDHIWPKQSDMVGAELPRVDVSHLSDWNMKRELESFQQTCQEIRRKYLVTPDPARRPKWLLVLVNKVDLYWDALDVAAEWYLPKSSSPFNETAQRLLHDMGQLAQFAYSVLPMTTDPAPYRFQSNFGGFEIECQLSDGHAHAALDTLRSAVEDLQ